MKFMIYFFEVKARVVDRNAAAAYRKRVRQRPHRYRQYCSIARALGVIGDRWSLLLVRELIFSAKRYSDLLAVLTGVSTNLLAARLKRLERQGVVRKSRLPPPAASVVYELTERGRLLEAALYALSRFGLHYLGPPPKGVSLDAESWLYGMRVAFNPAAAARVRETYEFRIDGQTMHVRVRNARFEARLGAAQGPAVVVEAPTDVLLGVVSRRLTPARALKKGALRIRGSRAAFSRFIAMFAMPGPDPQGRNPAAR